MSKNHPRRVTPAVRRGDALPQRTLLAVLVGAALAQFAALPARADSGTGVDTALGNTMNPAGLSSARDKDADGLGEASHSRTPTGFMIADPWALTEPNKSASGWLTRGTVEFGGIALGGNGDAAKFREYKSLKSGLYLNNFWAQAEKPDEAYYVEALGGALGRDDQYFGLTAGRYNSWRVKTFYSELDHVFTTTYRNLWSGTGTNRLTLTSLPAGPLAPATAASTDIAIGNAALATPYSGLSITRRKGGVRVDMNLPSNWKFFAAYTSESRKGARPFGLVSAGGGGTGGIEIPETVDYDTHDILAGVQWSNSRTSLNVTASASLFRDNNLSQTIDNPMFLAAANGVASFPQATFASPPSNDFYNLKAEFAHAMPELWRARVTGVVSASSSRQNASLIPSTQYSGVAVNGIAGGQWDTLASLSKSSADARIDSTLADLGLSLNPASGLDVKGKFRWYETRNSTEYWACNPLTGQWGRLINDGSNAVFVTPNTTAGVNPAGTTATAYNAAGCNAEAVKALNLVPSAGNVNIRNIPYDYKQVNTGLSADYRFARGQSVNASFERETVDRSHRERAQTWEDKLKVGYVNRAMAGGTLRASFEEARRRGTPYVSDPYDEFYSASFGGIPSVAGTNMTSWIHVNDLHRKFDLADRDLSSFNLRWNYALREDLDLGVAGQLKDQRYPSSDYGRNGHQRQNSLNFDLNWQPTPQTTVYGYAAQQNSHITQTGIQQNACVLGSTYYLFSDGSMAASPTPTAAQTAAGITVVGNSGVVTAANFATVCGSASPTSPLYPTSRAWSATQNDKSTSLGLGARHDFGRFKLDANYSFTRGRTAIGYTYNAAGLGLATSGAPTTAQLTALGLIGSGFPDLVYVQHVIDTSMLLQVNKNTALRFILRHEFGRIRDWHYDGVAANPTPSTNQQTYLDSGPQDWRVTTVGAMLQLSW